MELRLFQIRVCESDADRAAAMRLRMEVFVDEQGVPPELEPDAYDSEALHLLAEGLSLRQTPTGTARVVDRGSDVAKIGRVAVARDWRGWGVGTMLVAEAVGRAAARGYRVALLDAQVAVIPFYEKLGFVAEGPVFDDAGIPHRRMTKPL